MISPKLLTRSIFLLFIHISVFSSAQINDAQLWENICLEKNISPRLIARIVQEGRLTENYSRFSYNYLDMGLNYKFSKHLHGTIAYVWAEKERLNTTWGARHQLYGSLTFRKKWGDLSVNDRQMLLWQVKDYYVSSDGKIPGYYLRNKLTLRYDRSFRWAPYIAAELYYHINSKEYAAYRFDKLRTFAGLFFRTDKENEYEAYYMMERHPNTPDPQTNWVIGLGYTHSF